MVWGVGSEYERRWDQFLRCTMMDLDRIKALESPARSCSLGNEANRLDYLWCWRQGQRISPVCLHGHKMKMVGGK